MNVVKRMGFLEAVKTCLNKYANFTGRARRSEYWYFYLFYCIVAIVLSVLEEASDDSVLIAVIMLLFDLAMILPSLAAGVRRLHDVNKSGWNLLWSFILLFGSLYVLYLACKDSDPQENKYGLSPKYDELLRQ